MKLARPALAFAAAFVICSGLAAADDVVPPRRGGHHRVATQTAPHPDALQKLTSCGELRDFLTDQSVERLVEHLYLWIWDFPWSSPGGEDGGGDEPTDFSGTNNQESGVDELDMVKTDGTSLYITQDQTFHILRSWPVETAAEVATLPIEGQTRGLFVHDDQAAVFSYRWENLSDDVWYGTSVTRLDLVDIADRSQPVIARSLEVQGWLADARRIDGDVYAVIQSFVQEPTEVWSVLDEPDLDLPVLADDATWEDRLEAAEIARKILRPRVADVIAGLPDEAIVPAVRDRTPGAPLSNPTPLIACQDLFLDPESPDLRVLAIVHFDLDSTDPPGGPLDTTGIVAWASTVYASGSTLYVAEPGWARAWSWETPESFTVIHAFDLAGDDGPPVRYAATGRVDGWPLDQFAFSEYQGNLRVATSADWWNAQGDGSSVAILGRRGDRLVQVGRLDGIAPGERLYAVRFLGDVGYIVTFEQVDPLFTLDLADPTQPSVVGELEVTGFSTYLHPVGDQWLLSMGLEVNPATNRTVGLAVSCFDVSDLAAPFLAHRLVFDDPNGSWSEALYDHHAITYHRQVLTFPIYRSSGTGWSTALAVVDADPEVGLTWLGEVSHDDLSNGSWRNSVRRSVVIEDWLFSISGAGVKLTPLRSPGTVVATIPFLQQP